MKLLEPIQVGNITLKNRIMFPPLTTGYEGRDGSITDQSRAFYTRLAEGGVSYIVLGDVSPVASFSPTPRLFHDGQIEGFAKLADSVHVYGAKLGVQIFHPEYDVNALIELFQKKDMDGVRRKMHHDMQFFVSEVTEETLKSLGCADIPSVTVYNKCDLPGAAPYDPGVLLTSAKTGLGLDRLLQRLDQLLADRVRTIQVLLPYDALSLAGPMRQRGSVLKEEYRPDGLYLEGIVKREDLHLYQPYLV